jgi:hypothetical protein
MTFFVMIALGIIATMKGSDRETGECYKNFGSPVVIKATQIFLVKPTSIAKTF